MATINVLDAAGGTVALEKPLTPGRAAAATSRPVVLSTEDLAALTQIHTDIATTIAGYVDGLETLESAINAKLTAGTPANAVATTGGITTTARLPSAANSTNAVRVKASPGRIYSVAGKNNAAYDVFLVLYDSVVSPPVPGTTTIRKKIVCPTASSFFFQWPTGLEFATGIGYAFTKLVADADTTVLVAADITAFNLDYV